MEHLNVERALKLFFILVEAKAFLHNHYATARTSNTNTFFCCYHKIYMQNNRRRSYPQSPLDFIRFVLER